MSPKYRMAQLARTSCLIGLCSVLLACGTTRLEVDPDSFPIPVLTKTPVSLAVLLDEELTTYVHEEEIAKKGDWEVIIGPAQTPLFTNLASGVFEEYQLTEDLVSAESLGLDGTLQPQIEEVQFSLPSQTRSNYYEVWIRYQFKLFDRAGTLVKEWSLPAYGKANKKNHRSSSGGLQAAALAACRDAMAFFSINFAREPAIRQWIAAGKPLLPPPAAPAPAAPTQAPTGTDAGESGDGTTPQSQTAEEENKA